MSHKVLLVDDSITQLEVLKMQIAKSGYEVETAMDGYEGFKKVFETAPDLVLSDIVMPNLNGFQFSRLLKNEELTKKIPVILLTVLNKKIDKFWGNKSGANDFISKTAKYQQIEELIKKNIEQNPLSNEDKQNLQKKEFTDSNVQDKINGTFDELLMNSTFSNDFRSLEKYLQQEEVLIEKTFDLLESFIDYDLAGIFINNPDENTKKVLNIDVNKYSVSSFVTEKIKRDFFAQMPELENISPRGIDYKIIKDNISDEVILNADDFQSKHIIPLLANGKLIAGICFYNKEPYNFTDFKFYKTMIDELSLILKMRNLYSKAEYLSVTDGLTGLYNRRHFENNIEREYIRVRRYPAELSLAMIDIDHFKNVNDSYGHQFGDYVLKEISSMIIASFRKTDMIYRYGGEELAVILPETSSQNAAIPLERLREKISNYIFSYNGNEIHVNISIGIGCYSKDTENYRALIEKADKALYSAKQNGRNRLVIYSDEQLNKI